MKLKTGEKCIYDYKTSLYFIGDDSVNIDEVINPGTESLLCHNIPCTGGCVYGELEVRNNNDRVINIFHYKNNPEDSKHKFINIKVTPATKKYIEILENVKWNDMQSDTESKSHIYHIEVTKSQYGDITSACLILDKDYVLEVGIEDLV